MTKELFFLPPIPEAPLRAFLVTPRPPFPLEQHSEHTLLFHQQQKLAMTMVGSTATTSGAGGKGSHAAPLLLLAHAA